MPENDRKSRFDESCGKLHQNFRADVRQMSGQSNISTSSATRCSNVSQVHQHISHAALKFPRKADSFVRLPAILTILMACVAAVWLSAPAVQSKNASHLAKLGWQDDTMDDVVAIV